MPKVSAFPYFIVLLFSTCASALPPEGPQNKYGGQIVLSTNSDPRSFNDIIAKETSTTEIIQYLFEGLTRLDPFTLKVEPNLAEKWSVSEDGLQWTFYLRRDVTWNDGVRFTADDVVFTFNDLIYNPDIPSSARDVFTIEGKTFQVEKVDDHTVRFNLPVRFAPFLRGMGQSILPKHKLEKAVQEKEFSFTWGIDTPVNEIVGTGPFMLAKYEPGQRIVFKRNPHYWKRSEDGDSLPYLEKIIYLIIPNSDVELLKFLEGTIDFYGMRGMDYPLLKPLETEHDFVVYNLGPDTGSNFIAFNQNPGTNAKSGDPYVSPTKLIWFKDLAFRQAVAHAIEKQKIIDIVKNGLGYIQDSAMGEAAGFFHNPNVAKYDYNIAKAKGILSAAGFIDRNSDGIIEDPQGNALEFNLYTNADNTERMDIAAIIRHDLEKLGMKVNFQGLEFNTLVSKLTSTFEWDAIVLGLTGGVEPHFGKNVWVTDGQLHLWNPQQKTPATEWEKRVDDIFNLGVQELDEDKRKIFYDEFQEIVAQELPVVYTVHSARLSALRNKFENIRPTNYGGVLHNIEELYVKPGYR